MKPLTRYFRKYSRTLILVVMSLLLVLFLVGDIIGRGGVGSEHDVEIGRAFGQPVMLGQINRLQRDIEYAGFVGMRPMAAFVQDDYERTISAYLLIEEARRLGVRVTHAEVQEWLHADPQRAQAFDSICQSSGRSQASMIQALADMLAAAQLMQMQARAAMTESLPRIEHRYVDRQQAADVLVSAINAKAFLPRVAEPTEDELLAHFEAAKDRKDVPSDEELSAGYALPDRVEVEYLTIDPTEMAENITVLDKEARPYFEKNRAKYTKAHTAAPGEPDRPAATVPLEWSEARDQVKDDLRRVKAAEQAQGLLNRMREEALAPWNRAPRDASGHRAAPPESEIVSFESLRDKYAGQAEIVLRKTDLADLNRLRIEPGFGLARATVGRTTIQSFVLAFHVEGLPPQPGAGELPPLRVHEPGPIVNTFTGMGPQQQISQSYLFRVVRVVPSGPPASLDEVRAKVVANVKMQKAFELARQAAEKLAERARAVGLEEAVASDQELKNVLAEGEAWAASQPAEAALSGKFVDELTPTAPEQFHRQSGYAPNVGYVPSLVPKVFGLTTQPATGEGGRFNVGVFPAARTQKWAVVELKALKPVYEGEFRKALAQVRDQSNQNQFQTFWMEWLSMENIQKRTQWMPREPKQ